MATMSERSTGRRLAAYAAMAGAVVPAGAASGAIWSKTGLGLVATPDNPVSINFGGPFGRVFSFSVDANFGAGSDSTSTANGGFFRTASMFSTQSQRVGFDAGGAGGWTSAQVIPYVGNAPERLTGGALVGATGWPWAGPLGPLAGGGQNLAARFSYGVTLSFRYYEIYSNGYTTFAFTTSSGQTNFGTSYSLYDWAPDRRGFVGLRFTDNGTDWHYAWVDVEADLASRELTIHGWGLETTPNVGIEAGALPSPGAAGLGLLAMGAAGVRRHRRSGG